MYNDESPQTFPSLSYEFWKTRHKSGDLCNSKYTHTYAHIHEYTMAKNYTSSLVI